MAKWTIDPDHSVAAFSIRHMMIANVHGQFNKLGGTIEFDPANLSGTSLEFDIDASSIITGIQKRDDHLKSQDFFDIEKHPKISFKSTHTLRSGFNRCEVTGDVTIHGVTKKISVELECCGSVKSPFGETSMGFTAKTLLNREDYGITWNEPMENDGFMVGKNVHLFIELEADLTE